LRALTGVLVTLLAAATLSCTQPPPTGQPPTTGPPATGRYVESVFTDIEQVATATTFGQATNAGASVDLKLDMWAPTGDTASKRPVIVWMFGGAFIAGSRGMMNSYAQDSAHRGYVGVTIDYRLAASILDVLGTGINNAYDDAITAANWLKANAAQYRIDPDAIVAGGFSAGAINAVDVIVMPGRRGPATSPYAGAISNSGASQGAILGQNYSKAGQGPMIMFGGTTDNVVSYQNWQLPTCNNHKAAGNVCEFVSYDGLGHGVTSKIPELLNKSAEFTKRQVLAPKGYG
jgi:dienelactone hydrolase